MNFSIYGRAHVPLVARITLFDIHVRSSECTRSLNVFCSLYICCSYSNELFRLPFGYSEIPMVCYFVRFTP